MKCSPIKFVMQFCINSTTLLRGRTKHMFIIYAIKIDEFVCPPNISESVAVRIMKLAHRPRIASTTIQLISKPILLSILLKTVQRIGAGPKRKSSPSCVCLQ